MSRLFAAHLLQTAASFSIPGHYDQEQELWVGDNLLQGMKYPTLTQPATGHWWHGPTYIWNGCGYTVEEDSEWYSDPDDHDVGP
jgi:hypothetical protein